MKTKLIIYPIILLIVTGFTSALTLESADTNKDYVIDISDILFVASKFYTTDNNADVNNDNLVNLYDLVFVSKHLGNEVPLSLNKKAFASNSLNEVNNPGKVIDGDTVTLWNSGSSAEQWIEIDLEGYYNIKKIKLLVDQYPDGYTEHEIFAGQNSNPKTLIKTFSGNTIMNQWLEHSFPSSINQIRFIRIVTKQSPSWVAWKEIKIYGEPTTEPKYKIFDNGLKHKCVKTGDTPTTQDMPNLFEDRADCMTQDSIFSDHAWILGFQSEQDYGGKCSNYPAINSQNSPVTFKWITEQDGSLTAHLKQDYINYNHPCGKDYFNWYVFSNINVQGNKPYPRPDVLVSEHTIKFNKNIQHGSSRLIAAMSGFRFLTADRDPNELKPFQIEIALDLDDNWWDTEEGPVISMCYPETTQGCPADFIFIRGDDWNYIVNENQETYLRIEWWKVFQYLVGNDWLEPPYQYDDNYLSTGSVSIGFELKNSDVTDSVMEEVYISDFKISSK